MSSSDPAVGSDGQGILVTGAGRARLAIGSNVPTAARAVAHAN